jgi:hypothetical protein
LREKLAPNVRMASTVPVALSLTAAGTGRTMTGTADLREVPMKFVQLCADTGYTRADNFDAVAAVGGALYAPFKSKATGGVGGLFEKMFYDFIIDRGRYLAH